MENENKENIENKENSVPVENIENNVPVENVENNVPIENSENTGTVEKGDDVQETPRILIVEDDEVARLTLKLALEAENIFVEAVENGADAENMVRYSAFDVAIVDYRLPDIDGLNLIKKMKLVVPDIMTVVVTAHTSIEIAVEAMKMGAYDYMSKPLDIPSLIKTIYRILNDKKELSTSKQKLAEMVSKRSIDYVFNDEKFSIITAPNPDILVDGKSSGGIFKSFKKFLVGIKNYYWGA